MDDEQGGSRFGVGKDEHNHFGTFGHPHDPPALDERKLIGESAADPESIPLTTLGPACSSGATFTIPAVEEENNHTDRMMQEPIVDEVTFEVDGSGAPSDGPARCHVGQIALRPINLFPTLPASESDCNLQSLEVHHTSVGREAGRRHGLHGGVRTKHDQSKAYTEQKPKTQQDTQKAENTYHSQKRSQEHKEGGDVLSISDIELAITRNVARPRKKLGKKPTISKSSRKRVSIQDAALARKQRKNAKDRVRAAQARQELSKIKSIPADQRTASQKELLSRYESKRTAKNTRSRKRAEQRTKTINEIKEKPREQRTLMECKFLERHQEARRNKNVNDRIRRKAKSYMEGGMSKEQANELATEFVRERDAKKQKNMENTRMKIEEEMEDQKQKSIAMCQEPEHLEDEAESSVTIKPSQGGEGFPNVDLNQPGKREPSTWEASYPSAAIPWASGGPAPVIPNGGFAPVVQPMTQFPQPNALLGLYPAAYGVRFAAGFVPPMGDLGQVGPHRHQPVPMATEFTPFGACGQNLLFNRPFVSSVATSTSCPPVPHNSSFEGSTLQSTRDGEMGMDAKTSSLMDEDDLLSSEEGRTPKEIVLFSPSSIDKDDESMPERSELEGLSGQTSTTTTTVSTSNKKANMEGKHTIQTLLMESHPVRESDIVQFSDDGVTRPSTFLDEEVNMMIGGEDAVHDEDNEVISAIFGPEAVAEVEGVSVFPTVVMGAQDAVHPPAPVRDQTQTLVSPSTVTTEDNNGQGTVQPSAVSVVAASTTPARSALAGMPPFPSMEAGAANLTATAGSFALSSILPATAATKTEPNRHPRTPSVIEGGVDWTMAANHRQIHRLMPSHRANPPFPLYVPASPPPRINRDNLERPILPQRSNTKRLGRGDYYKVEEERCRNGMATSAATVTATGSSPVSSTVNSSPCRKKVKVT